MELLKLSVRVSILFSDLLSDVQYFGYLSKGHTHARNTLVASGGFSSLALSI